jgi:pimeloyl-CoA dehydrogenase
MDFSLTDDHLALQDAVRRFCDGEFPLHERGNPETRAQAAQRWTAMAELGLFGLDLDPAYGGSGQGAVEVMLAAQEFGRCLGGAGWLAGVLPAAHLIASAGTTAQREAWLPAIAAGSRKIVLAHAEADARYTLAKVSVRAAKAGNGWRIDGQKTLVPDGGEAHAFVIVARTSGTSGDTGGLTLFIVDANAPGVSVQPFRTLDGRGAAHVSLDAVTVDASAVLGHVSDGHAPLAAAVDRASAALCAEATGALEALIELTAEHVKTREQFGGPLAKLQVLQHRIADMLIALEQCRSMACAAAVAVGENDASERRRVVSAAKVVTAKASRQIAQWAIQMHGAMGMTDECRAGHYARRLLVLDQLFGDAAHHLQRFMAEHAAPAGHDGERRAAA